MKTHTILDFISAWTVQKLMSAGYKWNDVLNRFEYKQGNLAFFIDECTMNRQTMVRVWGMFNGWNNLEALNTYGAKNVVNDRHHCSKEYNVMPEDVYDTVNRLELELILCSEILSGKALIY